MKATIPNQVGAELVTISQYLASRAGALRVNPEQEGKRVYQVILSLVLDNGFSLEAKQSFPLVQYSFDQGNLTAWAFQMRHTDADGKDAGWIANLSRRDLNLFYSLQFIP